MRRALGGEYEYEFWFVSRPLTFIICRPNRVWLRFFLTCRVSRFNGRTHAPETRILTARRVSTCFQLLRKYLDRSCIRFVRFSETISRTLARAFRNLKATSEAPGSKYSTVYMAKRAIEFSLSAKLRDSSSFFGIEGEKVNPWIFQSSHSIFLARDVLHYLAGFLIFVEPVAKVNSRNRKYQR